MGPLITYAWTIVGGRHSVYSVSTVTSLEKYSSKKNEVLIQILHSSKIEKVLALKCTWCKTVKTLFLCKAS